MLKLNKGLTPYIYTIGETAQLMRRAGIKKIVMVGLAFHLMTVLPSLLFAQDPVVEKVMDHGGDESRLVLVVMGDGYREEEMEDYRQDVDRLLQGFFSATPWTEYQKYINVYRIEVISNESGTDHPNEDIWVDTALDSRYLTNPTRLYASNFKIHASVTIF